MIVNSITIFILIVYTTLLIYSSTYMIFFCILYVFSFQKRSLFLTFISCFICIFTLYLHYPIYILLLYIDTRVKRSKPTRACSYMRERPQDPPRYEHKSGMIIPRYANKHFLFNYRLYSAIIWLTDILYLLIFIAYSIIE